MAIGKVAIVGRPNVGKSTIFNRIIKERISIVEDVKGVTRDRLYAKAEWLTVPFNVIDTGGIEISDASFVEEIKAQAEIAIEESDVIILVVNGREGITNDDEYIANLLYQSKKPVIVAVNKTDDISQMESMYEFYQFGFEVIAVSGLHGIGIGDLLDEIISKLPRVEDKKDEGEISFALIGRPNVGKSSITNALLGENRVIVSDIAGTTRDAIDTPFTRDGKRYVVIDTAGMKKRGKIYESVDKYASLRAMSAIDRSDVVLVIIDAESGIIEQDKHIAGYAHEAGKAIIIVVNKWDLIEKDNHTMNKFVELIREEFKYLHYAPIAFVSALENKRMHTLFPLIEKVYENTKRRVQTSVLNDIIVDAQLINPTTTFNGGRAKIYYANQVAINPPTFVLFVNNDQYLHFSYVRYLENRLRNTFDFEGTPIKIILRKRE